MTMTPLLKAIAVWACFVVLALVGVTTCRWGGYSEAAPFLQSSSEINGKHTDGLPVKSSNPICKETWRGEADSSSPKLPSQAVAKVKVHFVIAHCEVELSWLPAFVASIGHEIGQVHIFSKCNTNLSFDTMPIGYPVIVKRVRASYAKRINTLLLTSKLRLSQLPNIGRCDHTYAKFISNIDTLDLNDIDIIFFVKDTFAERKSIGVHYSLGEGNDGLRFSPPIAKICWLTIYVQKK